MDIREKRAQPATPRSLDHNRSKALFSQLKGIIREVIESGHWTPGQAIPSERELSNFHHLSPMTVRQALDRLFAAGLLCRVDGKGTFASEPKATSMALSLAGLREQTLQMEHSASSRLLTTEKVLVSDKIAHVLNLATDAPGYLIQRVSYTNDVAVGSQPVIYSRCALSGLAARRFRTYP